MWFVDGQWARDCGGHRSSAGARRYRTRSFLKLLVLDWVSPFYVVVIPRGSGGLGEEEREDFDVAIELIPRSRMENGK